MSAAAPTTQACLLDHSSFPYLVDTIAAHCSSDTLHMVRIVSRGLKEVADNLLSQELVLEQVRGVIRASTPKRPLEQCVSAAAFSDRLPLQGTILDLVKHADKSRWSGWSSTPVPATARCRGGTLDNALAHSRITKVVLFPGTCGRYHVHQIPAPCATELAIHAGYPPLRVPFSCPESMEVADTRLHVVFVGPSPPHDATAAFRTVWFNQRWLRDLVYAFGNSSEIKLVNFAKVAVLWTHGSGTTGFLEELERGWFQHLLDVHRWSIHDALRDKTIGKIAFG